MALKYLKSLRRMTRPVWRRWWKLCSRRARTAAPPAPASTALPAAAWSPSAAVRWISKPGGGQASRPAAGATAGAARTAAGRAARAAGTAAGGARWEAGAAGAGARLPRTRKAAVGEAGPAATAAGEAPLVAGLPGAAPPARLVCMAASARWPCWGLGAHAPLRARARCILTAPPPIAWGR